MHVCYFQTFLSPCTLLLDPAPLSFLRKKFCLHVCKDKKMLISYITSMEKSIKVLIFASKLTIMSTFLLIRQIFTLHIFKSLGKSPPCTFIISCTFISFQLNIYPARLLDAHVYQILQSTTYNVIISLLDSHPKILNP